MLFSFPKPIETRVVKSIRHALDDLTPGSDLTAEYATHTQTRDEIIRVDLHSLIYRFLYELNQSYSTAAAADLEAFYCSLKKKKKTYRICVKKVKKKIKKLLLVYKCVCGNCDENLYEIKI